MRCAHCACCANRCLSMTCRGCCAVPTWAGRMRPRCWHCRPSWRRSDSRSGRRAYCTPRCCSWAPIIRRPWCLDAWLAEAQCLAAIGRARGVGSETSASGWVRRDSRATRHWTRAMRSVCSDGTNCWMNLPRSTPSAARCPRREALDELLQLAEQARHAARSSDSAITLTGDHGAPLAGYDGIWVLGLAEQRWPEAPRPDPYVPLSEQRRCNWDEAGARQRLEQAQWSLQQWRACAPELVLSHPRLEGDVHHRPSALPGLAQPHVWEEPGDLDRNLEPFCAAPAVPPTALLPMASGEGTAAQTRPAATSIAAGLCLSQPGGNPAGRQAAGLHQRCHSPGGARRAAARPARWIVARAR